MEKYFIISPETAFYKEQVQYEEDMKKINLVFKEVADSRGINSMQYVPHHNQFAIIPVDESEEVMNQLSVKTLEKGLRFFKKNSSIGRLWTGRIAAMDIKQFYRPWLSRYISGSGDITQIVFQHEGIMYGMLERNHAIELPVGFTEILASEFYIALEDNQRMMIND